MSASGLTGLLEGFFQALFLLAVFADVASAIISYFLAKKIAKRTAKLKAMLAFGTWTVIFFGCVILILSTYVRSLTFALDMVFLLFPFNFAFIVTWILGALIVIHEKPEGY